ncbi:MAG: lysophospholipid acyltransferase family protein [Polyangia bacterium]
MAFVRPAVTTLFLWFCFLGGFCLGGWLLFLVAGLSRGRRGLGWALAISTRAFIGVLRRVIPGLRLNLPARAELRRSRGMVVVCNHLSFLDPLLLLARLPDLITIVRPDFLRIPVFGWLLRSAGFLGPDLFAQGRPWLDRVACHLRRGGNLLIFPEGTRSRDGELGPFKKGAFYLARHLRAPILVLRIDGTHHVFARGRLTFDTTADRQIDLRQLAIVTAAEAADLTSSQLASHVRTLIASEQATGCTQAPRAPAR